MGEVLVLNELVHGGLQVAVAKALLLPRLENAEADVWVLVVAAAEAAEAAVGVTATAAAMERGGPVAWVKAGAKESAVRLKLIG
jgi:hypothetical protein